MYKKYVTILIVLLLPLFVEAQNVCYIKYTYDNSGNRIKREFFCGAPDNGQGGSQGGNNGGTNNRPANIGSEDNESGESQTKDYDFVVSPNPSNGRYRISLSNKELLGSTLEVYDSRGHKIYQQKLESMELWLDITQFANGAYYFYLSDEKHRGAKKVIKRE